MGQLHIALSWLSSTEFSWVFSRCGGDGGGGAGGEQARVLNLWTTGGEKGAERDIQWLFFGFEISI